MPLAMGGVGQEVHDALEARAKHLAAEGLARREGPHIVPQPDLLATFAGELMLPNTSGVQETCTCLVKRL
jgi:hypothetical protein